MNAVGESPAARVSAIPQPGRPSAPRDLTAVEAGQTQIDLNWAAPSNSGNSTIDGYRIEKSDNAGSDRTVLVANSAIQGTSHSDTSGLSPGATRHYRVSAINSAGIGAHSEVDRATAASPDGPPHPSLCCEFRGSSHACRLCPCASWPRDGVLRQPPYAPCLPAIPTNTIDFLYCSLSAFFSSVSRFQTRLGRPARSGCMEAH